MASKKGNRYAFAAFFLASFSCALGLVFCLVKSPQLKSQAYMAAAVEAMALSRPEDAAAAAIASVRLHPSDPQGWQVLSQILRSTGRHDAAIHADKIAIRLQQGPTSVSPVYAMPAEFRLSHLAQGESLLP